MATEIHTCYRHGDRRAGVSCQRCERPICPSCMVAASVGFHCPDCARRGRQKVLTARSLAVAPIVTQILVGINVAVFAIGLGQGTTNQFAGRGGLIAEGGLLAFLVADGEWYRVITSGFLHAGIMHLGFNMLALWMLGGQLERAVGPVRYLMVYVTSLLAGSLGVLVASPDALTVGASGAVFGLIGLAVAMQRSRGINIWDSGLGTLLGVNLLFTFLVPGISIGGHLGGLAGGYLSGVLLAEFEPRTGNKVLALGLCGLLGAGCFVASLVAAEAAVAG